MNPTKETRSYWKLSEEDMELMNALFATYEELEPQYNSPSPTQRAEWNNEVTCCKALFCLNAIYRVQGLLDSRLRKDEAERGSRHDPLESKASPFGSGTEEILRRIGTETDMMWGWWFGESPDAERTEEMMSAVETVKSMIKVTFELRTLCQGSKSTEDMEPLTTSMQILALQAAQKFELRWLEAFPIRRAVVPTAQSLKDCWRAEVEEAKSKTTVDGLDLGPEDLDGAMLVGNEEPRIDEDVGMSGEEYQPDLEAPKRVTRGATKTTKRTPSMKILSGAQPKPSATKRKAVVGEMQSEDEFSEVDSDLGPCPKKRFVPKVQTAVASSSHKRIRLDTTEFGPLAPIISSH
ncbi:hypothetical protein FRC00_001625 [Tulasnella sp. 408]|nr:hypothetical protein FRC00_001625 [Tulasnella sp. 408]